MSSRRKKQLNAEAAALQKAQWRQAVRDAGGVPYDEIDAKLKQTKHKRLVANDEELRAFQVEEVEFFRTRFGRHFSDGVKEFSSELKPIGFPVMVTAHAFRFNGIIYDLEPSDDLMVRFLLEYPEEFVPLDIPASEAELRSRSEHSRISGLSDAESLASHLVPCYHHWNHPGSLIRNEMKRRLPGLSEAEIQAAYDRARKNYLEWKIDQLESGWSGVR